MSRALILLLAAAAMSAATSGDVIAAAEASLSEVQRDEPGSPARAEAIAAALEGIPDLAPLDRLTVRLALAEAWLDGFQPARCVDIAAAVQKDPAATPAIRERAALARSAAARAVLSDGDRLAATVLLDELAQSGDAGPRAAAHLAIGRAACNLALGEDRKPADAPAALTALDEALKLLAPMPPSERIPVYLLRLTAMERSGAQPAEVLAWIQARSADPAAVEAAASATAAVDKLVGQAAPALKAGRLDRAGEALDLTSLRGKPVVVDFFASWCGPCAAVAPAVAQFAARHPEVQIIGVSLDNPQTMADLPAFMAKHGITWPVIGEKLGWDGELDDIWHVNGIPSLFLVGADGTLLASDLVGSDVDDTLKRLNDAVAGHGKPDGGAEKPAAGGAPFP